MPFNEKIVAKFNSTEDLVVQTGEGLELTFYFSQYAYMGESFFVDYTITNRSERTLYNLRPYIGGKL